jgi:hypothetical protein
MKYIRILGLSLGVLSFFLAGCSSDKPSTSARMPAPATVEPEVPAPTPVETPSVSASTSTSSTESSQSVAAPTDTGSPISLKDIPTKKINGVSYPYAVKTKWPGLVKSPYAQDKTLVDVSTLSPGSLARCPHTGKIFVVP